ncbi:cathepsin L1-like [Cimex lectularius]|uniref:Cathepsin L-like cysteine protease n=1 Tax=Cimex lectularius TaxID=79782 RepID=A0A8I6RKT2_CIMLE|nr:cathepsin L1-like [Cimex lectularius]
MKFILLVGILAAAQAAKLFDPVADEWELFKLQHKKNYLSIEEEAFRKMVFIENKRYVIKHNLQYEKGIVSFKLGLNSRSDMLSHELAQSLNGLKFKSRNDVPTVGSYFITPANVELPTNVDWRKHGAVTPVKDQGDCGSCWAFSTTGALEGQHYRKTGKLVSLSEQNLIDCSKNVGNFGCDGGEMEYAFTYIRENGGIDTETSYPYEAQDDVCRYSPQYKGAVDTGYVKIPEGDEETLKAAIASVGPISIGIDANHNSLFNYKEGVYYEPECSTENLDHGVLLVGYGTTDDGEDYWLVKNSWGTSWGMDGYVMMARNRNNSCGIATSASYPLV